MITRNGLLEIVVILAGLTFGYLFYRVIDGLYNRALSEVPEFYGNADLPSPSSFNLSRIYNSSKGQIQAVGEQNREAIRQAALRSQLLKQSREQVTNDREAYDRLVFQSEREVDMLRLRDYYSQFYMHYYQWLDQGDSRSSVQYKLALGQLKATLDYLGEKYPGKLTFSGEDLKHLKSIIRIAEQNNRTIRWARVELVVLVFLLLMGVPGLIRNSGLKKFSASLYFDSIFRPHRVSDLSRWHSVRRLGLAFVLLYFLGILILFSFTSWKIPLILGILGLVPPGLLMILSRQPGRWPALLVSYMAPKMLIILLLLGVLAQRGTGYLWYRFWDSGTFRAIFISLLFMLLFHQFQVHMILARKWSRRSRIASASMAWLALGSQLMLACALIYALGPEESLQSLNRVLMLLPPSLPEHPPVLLKWLAIAGGAITAGSVLILVLGRRKMRLSQVRGTG